MGRPITHQKLVLWPIDVTDLGVPKKENSDSDSEVANASFSPSLIFLIEIIGTFDQAKERENDFTRLLYAYSFSCPIATYNSNSFPFNELKGEPNKGMKKQSAQYQVSSRKKTGTPITQ